MRILHITDSDNVSGGGVPSYVRLLNENLGDGHVSSLWAPARHPPTKKEEVLAVWNPFHNRALREVIRSFRPDVLHVHGFYHRLSGAALGAMAATGVPAVLTAHAFGSVCPRLSYVRVGHGTCDKVFPARSCFGPCLGAEPLRNLVRYPRLLLAQKAIERHVAMILAPSKRLTSILAQRFPELPCEHVPHPLPLGQPEEPRPENRSPGLFLYVGRLLKSKGIDLVLRSFARLRRDGAIPPRLRIVGEGPDSKEARRLAETLGLAERVEFLGHLPFEGVLAEMRRCFALVVPSPIPETGPLVILEAFAVAAPVIATNHGGARELVRHGETGFLVEPRSVGDLAAGMRLMTDLTADGYSKMLAAVHRRALDFRPESHYDRVLNAYRKAVELGSERHS